MAEVFVRKASVLIIEGYDVRSVVLDKPQVTLGRTPANGQGKDARSDIEFAASIVSRDHGRFF